VIPGLSTAKLIGLAIAAAAIMSLELLAFHWKHQAADRGEKLAVICQSTRDASGQPKLKCSDVPAQIKFLGEAVTVLTNGIHRQSNMVDALGKESERQKAEAAKASQAAQKRSTGAQATATRLEASSRAGGPPCEPSKALKGAWQ
jgi:hypothetical protein